MTVSGDPAEIVARLNRITENLQKGEKPELDYQITSATIKDGVCNYSYEVTEGVNAGDTHNVKGTGLVMEDLERAFARLNVHMAMLDDVFKHAKVAIENIDAMRGHELALLYTLTGITFKGSAEDESIVLIGYKAISFSGEHIELKSPRIPLNNTSSYPFVKELNQCAQDARNEVMLYAEGKFTKPEATEETDSKQLTINDVIDENESELVETTEEDNG